MPTDIVSLYLARVAGETGTVRKDRGGRLSIALVYPNSYRLGMSNLGFQVVYHLFNKRPEVVAERFFLPEGKEMSLYLQSGKPLMSLESQTSLHLFDLVAFSLSFENDYPNILKLLELGGIPLRSKNRKGGGFPPVMAGGITTFLNPEPVADFMDFFLMGEAESFLDRFLDTFIDLHDGRAEGAELLKALATSVPNLYAPSLYVQEYEKGGTIRAFYPKAGVPETIRTARHVTDADAVPFSTIRTQDTEFSGKVLAEIGRGCGRSCRFCAAGYVYRPPRIHGVNAIKSTMDNVLMSCDKVGLIAAAVSDVPGIEEVTSHILKKGARFSVSSLRADSITRGLIEDLRDSGQKSLAIAPEAGSERMRRVINKHLSREEIVEAVRLISGTGDFSLRLYALIGLPTETNDDVASLVDLVKVIRHHMIKASAQRGSIGQIRLSLNCFIPKPFTPFQWFPMEEIGSLKQKQKRLKKALIKEGGISVGFDVPKWAYLQTLLSQGDRRVGSILLKAHEHKGDWKKAFRNSELNPDFFVYRQKGLDEILPWDFIDNGVRKAHLKREYDLALKAEESDECRMGDCRLCGACSLFDK